MFIESRSPKLRVAFTIISIILVVSNLRPDCLRAFIANKAYAKARVAGTVIMPRADKSLVQADALVASLNNEEEVAKPEAVKLENIVADRSEERIFNFVENVEINTTGSTDSAAKLAENAPALKVEDVTEDVKIPDQYVAKYVNNPDMAIQLSEYELHLLEELVYGEAGNQDMIGQILLANVVINRVNSPYFPDTVYEVIDQPGSFSRVSSGRFDGNRATDMTKEAVRRALSGEDYSQGANSYMNPVYCSQWAIDWFNENLIFMFIHQDHYFYRTPRA